MLIRFNANFGDQFGRDEVAARLVAETWSEVLGELPEFAIDAAANRWLKTESQWPKPADIRKICLAVMDERAPPKSAFKALPDRRTPEDKSRVAYLFELLARHKKSETPYSDLVETKEWKTYRADYERRTGAEPFNYPSKHHEEYDSDGVLYEPTTPEGAQAT